MKISNIRSHYEVIIYYGNAELYGKIVNCCWLLLYISNTILVHIV